MVVEVPVSYDPSPIYQFAVTILAEPVTVNEVQTGAQPVLLAAIIAAVGNAFTIAFICVVPLQPLASVTVKL